MEKEASAFVVNFDDCGIDGLVEGVTSIGVCLDDNRTNKAVFAYQVRFIWIS